MSETTWTTLVGLGCLYAALVEFRRLRAGGSSSSRWWFVAFLGAAGVCTVWVVMAVLKVPGG